LATSVKNEFSEKNTKDMKNSQEISPIPQITDDDKNNLAEIGEITDIDVA